MANNYLFRLISLSLFFNFLLCFTTSASASGENFSAEQACLSHLQESAINTGSIPASVFYEIDSADIFSPASASFFKKSEHTRSIDQLTGLDIQDDFFLYRGYMGQSRFPVGARDVYDPVSFWKKGASNTTQQKLSEFMLAFAYRASDQSFLYCRLLHATPAHEGVRRADIFMDQVGPWHAPIPMDAFSLQNSTAGILYQNVGLQWRIANRTFSDSLLLFHDLYTIPKNEHVKDFNPFHLADAILRATKAFHDVYLPMVNKFSEENTDFHEDQIMMNDIRSRTYHSSFLTHPPLSYNGSFDNRENYTLWLNYWLLTKMVLTGQSSFMDILERFSPHAKTSHDAMASSIQRFINTAINYNRDMGHDDPHKKENVMLFWRLKQQIDAGASEQEIKDYIAAYPRYLKAIDEARAQMDAMEKMQTMSDLDRQSWYAQFVFQLMSWGVMDGYTDGSFRPGDLVNRAEFAKIVTLLFGLPVPESITKNPFPDVPKDAWYAPFVQAAKDAGVVAGYPDGSFGPAKNVNRAEAMKMLFAAANRDIGTPAYNYFPDVADGAWFANFVNLAAEKGIATGYDDGHFRPAQSINRAEIAKMAARARQVLWQGE